MTVGDNIAGSITNRQPGLKNVIQLKMARLYAEVQYCFGEFAVCFTSNTLVPNITKKV